MADEELDMAAAMEEMAGDDAAAGADDMAAAMGGDMAASFISDDQKKLNLEAVYDIPVEISVVLGSTVMSVTNLLKLNVGTIVELDRKVGETVDIYINKRMVARGEIVIVEENIGITLTEIIKIEQQ